MRKFKDEMRSQIQSATETKPEVVECTNIEESELRKQDNNENFK